MSIALCVRRATVTGLLVCVCAVTAFSAKAAAEETVKLSGCLVRGEGDGGYLLTNPPAEPWLASSDRRVTPSGLGTSGDYATIFYWLDGHDDLRQHIGHRIEIEGDLKGDVKQGEIKTVRKDNWTELTVRSDGQTMKAQVPNMSLFPAPDRDKERTGDILVRRVDVERVRMIGASCG
jgi:hypothetical protein